MPSWAKKAAIIDVKKARNIRLSVLVPPKAYEYVAEFAENHDVSIFKTQDYLTLERKEARKNAEG
ncbi:hypothetical protein MUN88_00835 [Gracilibacillus caseinilyticus]|uniref:CopG family transcriptional regulator n=1 Tax=Gracilibacillus caseinilyticus TaxID=2932256 RepID=A0ABY4EXP4_9BACI|nr:hypothetical protein [Gracilibacillus caseinilyticus]UOQ48740.1 hypothetical protein MUN88_00835 [Gracilibacillus caseinilyticus]